MDLLQRIIDVSLVLDVAAVERQREAAATGGDGADAGAETEGLTILPRQPLRSRLTVSFANADGGKTATAAAFLSLTGEHSLPVAWRHLLERLTLVPFLLDRADADEGAQAQPSSAETSPRSAPLAEQRGSVGVGGGFVFGVPTFWNDKLYAHPDEEDDEGPWATPCDGEGGAEKGGLAGSGSRLPCRTAGEAFEVDASAAHTVVTPSTTPDGGTVPAGIVSTYDFPFTVPEVNTRYLGRPASLAFVLLLSPLADTHAPATQGGTRDDWPPYQRYVAMRVLSRAFVDPFDPSSGGGLSSLYSMHTILLGCQYLPVTVRHALVCQSVTCPLSNDRLLLNLNIRNVSRSPVILHSASLDVYSTCTIAAGASLAPSDGGRPREPDPSHRSQRNHHRSQQQQEYQQRHERRMLQQDLWAEQRAGPAGADMRTIDVLTKIVTVTPMVVSDDRPPFTLHADETYSFQFILEVLPQLCYLLNPKSLQYVYARYAHQQQQQQQQRQQQQLEARDDAAGADVWPMMAGGGMGRGVVMPRNSSMEAVITDCYGEPVSNEEIVSVLSASYLSYLFVYFDLVNGDESGESAVHVTTTTTTAAAEGAGGGGGGGGTARTVSSSSRVKMDGLHLRHAARWSFGAA